MANDGDNSAQLLRSIECLLDQHVDKLTHIIDALQLMKKISPVSFDPCATRQKTQKQCKDTDLAANESEFQPEGRPTSSLARHQNQRSTLVATGAAAMQEVRQASVLRKMMPWSCLGFTSKPWFEILVSFCILSNTVFIAVEVQHRAAILGITTPFQFEVSSNCCGLAFLIEIILRMSYGLLWFFSPTISLGMELFLICSWLFSLRWKRS